MSQALRMLAWAGCVCAFADAASGQTMVDLRTQSKSVDFSAANATRPFKTGTSLPAICNIGEIYYKTDAAAGSNLYGCVAPNAWALEGQGGAAGLPPVAGAGGNVLSTDGSSVFWTAVGGDLSGPASAATVVQLQGRPVSAALPQQGQALAWNGTTNRWEPQTVSGGGGGGTGISMLAQAADLMAARTNASTLSIGANCSAAAPCNVRFGTLVFSIISGATATVTGGTGVAFVYVSSTGAITVGHALTVSCSATCSAQSGVTGFPADSIPLFTWSATNGSWDVNGGTDQRAFLSAKVVQPGAGLTSAEIGGKTTLSADPALIGMRAAVPASAASACVAGAWAADASFYYVCVSSGGWRRAALASF